MGEHDNIEQPQTDEAEASNDNYTPLLAMGLAFELGLAAVGFVLGWMLGPWPWINQSWNALPEVGWVHELTMSSLGVLAALPLLLLVVFLDRMETSWVRGLANHTRNVLGAFICGAPIYMLLVISLAAGFGEELFFRGWLQRWLEMLLGAQLGDSLVAILLTSIIFGVCHALSWTYAIAAAAVGAYMSLLLNGTHSLLCPIAAHAAYDFLAMLWMRHQWRVHSRFACAKTLSFLDNPH